LGTRRERTLSSNRALPTATMNDFRCLPANWQGSRSTCLSPQENRYCSQQKRRADATIWHSPGYTLVLSWLSQKWLKYCHKLAPGVLKDADLHLPKDQRKLCLDWAADELTRQITRRRQRFH